MEEKINYVKYQKKNFCSESFTSIQKKDKKSYGCERIRKSIQVYYRKIQSVVKKQPQVELQYCSDAYQ